MRLEEKDAACTEWSGSSPPSEVRMFASACFKATLLKEKSLRLRPIDSMNSANFTSEA